MKYVADPIDFIRNFNFQRWVNRPEGDKKLQEALIATHNHNVYQGRDNNHFKSWAAEGGIKRDEVQLVGAETPASATQLTSGPTKIDLRIVLSLFNEAGIAIESMVCINSDQALAVNEVVRWLDLNKISVWPYAKLFEHDGFDELRICIDNVTASIDPFNLKQGLYVSKIAKTLQFIIDRTACLLNCDDPTQVIIYPSALRNQIK